MVFLFPLALWPAQKARVVSLETAVYENPDFDAAVIKTINPNETFIISKKIYGAFYKVKFKDGTLGFIPDTELDIEGRGPFQPKEFIEDRIERQNKKLKLNNKLSNKEALEADQDLIENDTEDPQINYHGLSFQLINFKENTLGSTQVSDLFALGYKFQPLPHQFESKISYEILVAPAAPDYYEELTKAKVNGGVLWLSAQVSNINAINKNLSYRYGAGPFTRLSYFNVKGASNKPDKNYDLVDLNLGVDLQAALLVHTNYTTFDFGLRYFFDRQPYGGFGLSFLF